MYKLPCKWCVYSVLAFFLEPTTCNTYQNWPHQNISWIRIETILRSRSCDGQGLSVSRDATLCKVSFTIHMCIRTSVAIRFFFLGVYSSRARLHIRFHSSVKCCRMFCWLFAALCAYAFSAKYSAPVLTGLV